MGFVTLQAAAKRDNLVHNLLCDNRREAKDAAQILIGRADFDLLFVRIREDGRDDEYVLGENPARLLKAARRAAGAARPVAQQKALRRV